MPAGPNSVPVHEMNVFSQPPPELFQQDQIIVKQIFFLILQSEINLLALLLGVVLENIHQQTFIPE